MGRADYYKHSDYNVICDECGFKRKASECRKRWDNAFVCADTCWEARHSQEYVRSKHDRQRVPLARVDKASILSQTAVKTSASAGAVSLDVNSISGMTKYDAVGITLDGGRGIHWTFHNDDPSGNTIYIQEPLPHSAAADNVVYVGASSGVKYLATNEVSVDDL